MTTATTRRPTRNRALGTRSLSHRSVHWFLFALALFAPGQVRAQQPLFTFVQVSDSQPTDSDDQLMFELVLDTIVDAGSPGALLPYPVDYVVFAGDLVDSGNNTSEWNTFVQTINQWLTANGIAFRAVPGNHDRSTNFGNYNQFIGSPATWSMGSETFVGHNGIQINTGWRGLRHIGINNTNGGNNVISAADLAAVNVFVPAAVAANENIFLMTHHPHNEVDRMPLAGILNTPEIVGYMRGHTSSPGVIKGLTGVSNPNVWETKSNAIYRDGAILYFEVFQNDLEAHVIELVDNPSQLPSPQIIHLVNSLVDSGGGPPTTLPPGSTTTLPEGTTTTTTISPPSGSIVLGQVRTGTSASSNTVSTSLPLTAVTGDLYLAAVSTKNNTSVVGVSGLGLTWSPVVSRCAGRNQTGVSIWKAQGTPTASGTVTASLNASVSAATIAVSRYAGAGQPVVFDDVESANTNGVAGACSGGTDTAAYSFGVTSLASNSVVYGAVGMRNRQHIPGAGYTQQASIMSGSGGTAASVAVFDRSFSLPSTITVNGSFDGSVDWAVAAVVIPGADKPAFCTSDLDCDDGNECTADDCDASGNCILTDLTAGTACTGDGNPCTNDQCNGAGACLHPANAASCNDGLFCNGADTCSGGACSVHAGDPCTGGPACAQTCSEAADTCNAPVGSPCDDGNECTANQCNGSGACTSAALPTTTACTSDGNPCTDDRCDGAGACVHPANAALCEDGAFCNGVESCVATICQPGTPPTLDDGVACTDDSCDELNDVVLHAPNDASCDDGAFCNGPETCDALLGCQAGTPPTLDDGVACTNDSCDEVNDVVVHAPSDSLCDDGAFCNGAETCDALLGCQAGADPCVGSACNEGTDQCVACLVDGDCDDGLFCNGAETCVANACQAGTPPTVDDGVACTDDSCDETNDVAVHTPNDAICDDGVFCNGAETCDALLGCQAGTPPTLDDGVACTNDSCDEVNDIVVHAPSDALCDDGAFCNGAETCGAFLGCQAGSDPCVGSACDEGTDQCVACLADGDCDDGAFCNGVETCVANACQPGTPPTVDDGIACTDDSCDETNDVAVHTPNDASCDDGEFCNGAETCDALLGCQAGTPPTLDDGVACTNDSCDEVNDVVVHAPSDALCDDALFCNGAESCDVLLDCQAGNDPCVGSACDEGTDQCVACLVDGDCDDGAFCNGAEACVATVCLPGTPIACADSVGCTVDSCNEATDDCDNAPSDALCDDGEFCNGAESCDSLLGCQAGTPPTLDDGIACTNDSCDEPNDVVVHAPSNALCDDGTFCNGAEICNSLSGCQAGAAPTIDDGVPCTNDSCDEANDVVVHAPSDALCDDALFCNGTETCSASSGCQAGTPVDCTDGVACTVDSCNEPTDDCDNTPSDAACSDGAFCNGSETCNATLGCQAGTPVNCDDADVCTTDSCNETNDICDHVDTCEPPAPVTAEEVRTGSSVSLNSVTTAQALSGVAGNLYLAAVSYKPNTVVTAVNGLGLAWTRVGAQCAGRAQTGIEVWRAQGSPIGSGVVTASLQGTVSSAVIAVTRYSGVSTSNPVGSVESANSLGVDGPCAGGIDAASYSYSLPGVDAGAVVYSAVAMRSRTHTPGAGYQELVELVGGSGGSASSEAVSQRAGAAPGTILVNGTFNGTADWAALAVEVRLDDTPTCGNDAECSDGQFCNGVETCVAGSCQAGTPVNCADGVTCTADSCDEPSDTCTHTLQDAACNDGLFCSGTESCTVGGCQAGTAVDCSDGVSCTIDSCNESTDSCVHTPDDAACSDGTFCNGGEVCDPSLDCQGGEGPCPGLGCDESGDFCICTTDGQCDDGLFCNGIESCVAGSCQAGTPVDCTDGVACTVDACNETTDDCDNTPSDAACSDGAFCNGSETCNATLGCQAGTPVNCDDADVCTTDTCNETNDICDHVDTCEPPAPVTAEEVRTGSSVSLNSVTTAQALSGVAGNLYLAAVSYKPNTVVTAVNGLGLAWTRVGAQCAGRAQTGIEVWRAQGSPTGSGVVTASLQGTVSSAVIAVTRYSGVSTSNPVGSVESANSLGVDGPCAGGIDAASYSYSLPGVDAGAVVYSAVAMRSRTHTPGAGYQELVELVGGSGGSASSEAVSQRAGAAPGTILVNGTFNGTADWAGFAVEVLP